MASRHFTPLTDRHTLPAWFRELNNKYMEISVEKIGGKYVVKWEEALREASDFSSFCQKFKMEFWGKYPNRQIGDGVLDELAKIAWGLLIKS